jgi:uncharacterized glyoxalase superfamily protein PhnB
MAAKKTAKRSKRASKTASRSRTKSVSKPRAAAARPTTGGALSFVSASPSFTVDDLKQSLDWYTNVLGFAVKDRWEVDGVLQGAELKAGNATFYIGQDDWKKGRDRTKGEGFRLYCETSQNLDALAKKIVARGGRLDHEPTMQPWGTRDFAVTDPNGFKLTIAAR